MYSDQDGESSEISKLSESPTCASWIGESAPLSGVFLLCTDGVMSGRRRGVFDLLSIGVRGVPGVAAPPLPLPFPLGVAVDRLAAPVFDGKYSDNRML